MSEKEPVRYFKVGTVDSYQKGKKILQFNAIFAKLYSTLLSNVKQNAG